MVVLIRIKLPLDQKALGVSCGGLKIWPNQSYCNANASTAPQTAPYCAAMPLPVTCTALQSRCLQLSLDGCLRRRRDLGAILFGVPGRLDLAAQQLGKFQGFAFARRTCDSLDGDGDLTILDSNEVLHRSP